jgi:hypothetical protein
MVDLAYNNASSLAINEFDDALDLSEAQENQLEPRLRQFFAWHRQQELQHYQQLLEQAARYTADGLDATEFLTLNKAMRRTWQRTLEKAIDDFGELAATLGPEQIERFQQYYLERSDKYEDYLKKSPQQREIYRIDSGVDRLENWFGDFQFDQQERVRTRLRRLPEFYPAWIKFRDARQQALIEVLSNASGDSIQQELKTALLDPSTEYALAFEPTRIAYWQAYAEALQDISGWLTRAQRHRAANKLKDYARVAERLANQD